MQHVVECLRTGDCLVRTRFAQDNTSHLTFEQYESLRAKLPPLSVPISKPEITDDLLTETDTFSDFQRIHRPDVSSDHIWTTAQDTEFNPDEWISMPLPSLPETPQPPPSPLEWDLSVTDPPPVSPQEYYSSGYRAQLIPNLRKRTSAKTSNGLKLFANKMAPLWAERKALFAVWNAKIRSSHSDSVTPNETPLRCARCGASVFSDEIKCRDCGKNMRSWVSEEPSFGEQVARQESGNISADSFLANKHVEQGTKGRKRRQISAEMFIAGKLAAKYGRLTELCEPEMLTKAANAMEIAVAGLLPRDIAAQTGESERAIRERCAVIFAAIDEYARESRALPTIPLSDLFLLNMWYPADPPRDIWKIIGKHASAQKQRG